MARAMTDTFLPEFILEPDDYGWSGKFPTGPHHLFEQKIGIKIHTREVPDDPKILPPVSQSQATLVRAILTALPAILKRVEEEMTGYNQKFDPNFQEFISHPHVWLSSAKDDGMSWTFVVERMDNPDFAIMPNSKAQNLLSYGQETETQPLDWMQSLSFNNLSMSFSDAASHHRRRLEKRWPPLDFINGRCVVENLAPEV
jgi:hypothetical protein